MATLWKIGRILASAMGIALFSAILFAAGAAAQQQPATISITLAGQSMLRSDARETAPKAVPAIQGLLKGDVIFTNLESAVAEKGEAAHEGRGFLTPPEALDALQTFGLTSYRFPAITHSIWA